ncbi:polysaccharide deacetylase family protein [Pannus brasiliensis CCIBt3594]|uniref:Polysaccharide deacetylase family protein n=1 Tax=Pannus brasiliensis CCIBt3594 TaxID=1427578 RepID=A0AAW9QT12_9CHRO
MRELLIPIARQFPEAIFYQPTRERTIALTIDDVGDPSTEIILEAIERQNQSVSNSIERVRATFFIITDFLAGKTEIIDEILKRGHEIGNHGCFDRTHADLWLPGEFDREITTAHEILSDNREGMIRWFRPGRGRYNRLMSEVLQKMVIKHDYNPLFALASMIPLDTFDFTGSPKFTLSYLSRFIFPGSILVLHGGSKIRSLQTAEVLRELLPTLRERGYRVTTLSEAIDPNPRASVSG